MTSNRLTECKMEYMDSMKEDFQRIKEHNACRGETVSLQNTYTNLQLIKGPQIMEEKMHEILNSGKGHLQNLKEKSDKYSQTTIETLFDPEEDGFTPKIVVLQGPAGIGKSMTSRKIMLDWASGNLYQDKFNFVFHLSCRELNTITGPISLVGLLSRTSKLSSDDLVSILKDPANHRKLLFMVDGFDELSWTLEKKSEVCHDIFEQTHKDLLLQRLFRKQILKQSSLIITTRPLALEKLYSFVDKSRDVEVMGFTNKDCGKYFHNFFKNKKHADKALSLVKDNDVLYPMCTVPIVCWIVCTVMKPQIKQDLDLLQSKTATSVYLLYLKGLIKHHCREQPTNTCLKKLCALARDGILNQKILFEMEDLNRHGLSLSEVESVFLNENLFHLDIDTQTCYSFNHLSVQEFLAALYYVLDDGSGNEEGTTGLGKGTSIPEICKGDSLSIMCKEYPHLALAVRFLFGLLNEKEVKTFSKSTGINISPPARQAMEEWLMGQCLLKDSHTGNTWATYSIEAILCLYETQNKEIIRRIISYSSHLKLIDDWKGGFPMITKNYSKQLCYCLMTSESLQALSFTYFVLEPKHLQMLSSLLHGCQELRLKLCPLTLSCIDVLRSLNELKSCEITLLSKGLRDPGCTVQELTIDMCELTPLSCNGLQSVLIANRSITKLVLSRNPLGDSGIKHIFKGLKHPNCTLKELSINMCELTRLSCNGLQSVLFANRSLTKLDLSWNHLGDSGIKQIFKGLKHPDCTLKELRFYNCQTTLLCCDDLCSAISTNQTLSTLETRFDIDEKISESDRSLEGLRRLGCTVEIIRYRKLYPDGNLPEDFLKTAHVEIKYRRPSLHMGPC
ncbi:NACHT, LRR and PYD domains-containing protein 12-like isoform X2 [Lithobates pipiens]